VLIGERMRRNKIDVPGSVTTERYMHQANFVAAGLTSCTVPDELHAKSRCDTVAVDAARRQPGSIC
jgi:hypothetical protein